MKDQAAAVYLTTGGYFETVREADLLLQTKLSWKEVCLRQGQRERASGKHVQRVCEERLPYNYSLNETESHATEQHTGQLPSSAL